jgi:hypothetical protein
MHIKQQTNVVTKDLWWVKALKTPLDFGTLSELIMHTVVMPLEWARVFMSQLPASAGSAPKLQAVTNFSSYTIRIIVHPSRKVIDEVKALPHNRTSYTSISQNAGTAFSVRLHKHTLHYNCSAPGIKCHPDISEGHFSTR